MQSMLGANVFSAGSPSPHTGTGAETGSGGYSQATFVNGRQTSGSGGSGPPNANITPDEAFAQLPAFFQSPAMRHVLSSERLPSQSFSTVHSTNNSNSTNNSHLVETPPLPPATASTGSNSESGSVSGSSGSGGGVAVEDEEDDSADEDEEEEDSHSHNHSGQDKDEDKDMVDNCLDDFEFD